MPNVPVDTLKRVLPPTSTTPTPDNTTTKSFEDTLIKTLRAEGKPWSEITTHLNESRVSNNDAPTWTEAGVYSRFILNASATATPAREVGFEPRDYAYLRNAGSGREGTSKAGKKRVKDFQNATELSANIRKPVKLKAEGEAIDKGQEVNVEGKGKAKRKSKSKGKDEERRKGEEDETVKMDQGLAEAVMRAVAKVERNFWVFVADEVEREGGKYIEPKELEKVFRGI